MLLQQQLTAGKRWFSLAEYIDKATVLCDQCEYPPEARDRLFRETMVICLRSREAYFKRIEKGSALTLEEAITIAQNEDTTASQVGYYVKLSSISSPSTP